ncbi:MAG: hypothetical protein PVG49_17480 [Desulfobacteraceae bacterium]|jgi:hypothetical protein
MRKQKTFAIGGKRFTVREFRVRDVRRLLEPAEDPGRAMDWLLPLSVGEDARKIAGLTRMGVRKLWAAIEEVNAAYFNPPEERLKRRSSAQQSGAQPLGPDTLDQCACKLIERGHAGVWDYGWGFFMTALRESGRLEKERLRGMALAVRMGQANRKAWRSFFSGC